MYLKCANFLHSYKSPWTFAKTIKKKAKEIPWTSSTISLTYPHFLSIPLKSQNPLNVALPLHQPSEPSGNYWISLLNMPQVVNPIFAVLGHQHSSQSRLIISNVSTYQGKLSPGTVLMCYHSNSCL